MEVVGIGTKQERKKERKKENPIYVLVFIALFSLTKFSLSSLFGPILASSCGSVGLT